MPTPVTTAPRDYRLDIQGLRAIAVLSVVLYHANRALLPGGFIGVDIFFVISGYLIAGILLVEIAQGHFSLVGFYLGTELRFERSLGGVLFPVLFPTSFPVCSPLVSGLVPSSVLSLFP
jgi:hypothetical protein